MKVTVKPADFEAGGKAIVMMNIEDVSSLGVHGNERVKLTKDGKCIIAIIDVTKNFAKPGEIVTNSQVNCAFKLRKGDQLEVSPAYTPESVAYIKQKLAGGRLSGDKLLEIVKDVVANRLSETEVTAFVTALDSHGMTMEETEALSRAMIATGKKLHIPGKCIVDKHSLGGIPGDKTSLLAVPIIAAAGLTIPKTSSRAITSPAGTADRMEVLAPVEFSADDIVKIVKKTGGCLVWGGALDLAPADDAFIKIEFPLGIDPLLLPSIMSKKAAVGSKYLVVDIPTGRGAKMKTIGASQELADHFIELGRRLGIKVVAGITYGEQPLGHAMGPALEAREALSTIMGGGPTDLIDKVTSIVGLLFEEVSVRGGKETAMHILKSGKAEKKLREIIDAQGGDPKVKPSDIAVGKKTVTIDAETDGRVLWISNGDIGLVAREAGAPADKGAGVLLHAKIGDSVKKGQPLFTIYSEYNQKLANALKCAKEFKPVSVFKSIDEHMLMAQVPTHIPRRHHFILER
ncbi:MAG: AMP phosphorylase [Candidatus Aenigmatarchaeota archaeon]